MLICCVLTTIVLPINKKYNTIQLNLRQISQNSVNYLFSLEGPLERASKGVSTEEEVQVNSSVPDADVVIAVAKASVECQVEFGELQMEEREDSNENILADLQKAVDLTRELMEKNKQLKIRMKLVSEENERYKNQHSAVSLGEQRLKELERVQLHNRELQREVNGLKRTINEQSMYLLQFGHDSNLHSSTCLTSEPNEDEEKNQQQQHSDGASLDVDETDDPQTTLDPFISPGNGFGRKSPETKKRFRSKQRRSGKMLEVGNGLEASLELAGESEGDVPEDDLVESASAGNGLQYAMLQTEEIET